MRLKSHALKSFGIVALAVTLCSVLPGPTALAVDLPPESSSPVALPLAVWQFLAGSLVLLMPAGLAMLATGLTRAKNASHTAFMTFFGCSIAIVAFWIAGFAVMHGGSGFFLRYLGTDPGKYGPFFWKASLLCVAASIPVGALAERWSLKNFYLCTLFMSLLLFPLFTLWASNDGWLGRLGYVDFAGSGTVHALGGIFALVGATVLGPRIGRYNKNGAVLPITAHNIPLSLLGGFLLSIGWLGFNMGRGTGNVPSIATVTILAGAGGAITAATYMIMTTRRPDPTITLNGLLAGLVASSASAAYISPTAVVLTSVVAGLLVCVSIQFFDRRRIDDPVGAISVHGVCGLWGVLATGIFANGDSVKGCLHGNWGQLGSQAIGCVVLLLWAGGVSWIFLRIADKFIPMRVATEVELEGLDIPETGLVGYPDFQQVSPHTGGFSSGKMRRTSREE